MKPLINWSAIREIRSQGSKPMKPQKPAKNMWDGHADMYNMMAGMEREYTFAHMDCIPTTKEDTVLDVGCGPGRITQIMAERAKSVTGIDTSENMMEHCRQNVKARGLNNVNIRHIDWTTAQLGKDLEKHDIVIASRSVGLFDFEKLSEFSNKYAAAIAFANADSIPDVLNGLFKNTSDDLMDYTAPVHDRRFGYNIMYNEIYDLGYEPNVNILKDGFTKDFDNIDDAAAFLRNLRAPFDDKYLPVFKENLAPYISENSNGGVTFRRETRAFVIWWDVTLKNS